MFSRWCPRLAAALGMQRKVIYCCTKAWANQKVKFITKDNSCFHNSRSLSQKLCSVCSLGSSQQKQCQQHTKLSREGLAFLPFPSLHSQVVPGPGFTFTTYLHIPSLPQPLKHPFPNTLTPSLGPAEDQEFSPSISP